MQADDVEVRLYDAPPTAPGSARSPEPAPAGPPDPGLPPPADDAFEAFHKAAGVRVGQLLDKMDADLFAAADAACGVPRSGGPVVAAGPAPGTLSGGQPRPDLEWTRGGEGPAAFMRVRGQGLPATAGDAGARPADGAPSPASETIAEQWDPSPPPADLALMDEDALDMAIAAEAAYPVPTLPLEELGYSAGTLIHPVAMPSALRGAGPGSGSPRDGDTEGSRRSSAKRAGGVRFHEELEVHEIPGSGSNSPSARATWTHSDGAAAGGGGSSVQRLAGGAPNPRGSRFGSADWSGTGNAGSGGGSRSGGRRTASVTEMAPLLTFSLQSGAGQQGSGRGGGGAAAMALPVSGGQQLPRRGGSSSPSAAGALRSVGTLATLPGPRAASAAAAVPPPYLVAGRRPLGSSSPNGAAGSPPGASTSTSYAPQDGPLRVASRGDHDAAWGPWDDAEGMTSPLAAAAAVVTAGRGGAGVKAVSSSGGGMPSSQRSASALGSSSGGSPAAAPYPGFVLPQDAAWLAGIAELRASLTAGKGGATGPSQLDRETGHTSAHPQFRAAAAGQEFTVPPSHSVGAAPVTGKLSFRGLAPSGLTVEGAPYSGGSSSSGGAHGQQHHSHHYQGRLVTGHGPSPLPSPAGQPAVAPAAAGLIVGTAVVPPPPQAPAATPTPLAVAPASSVHPTPAPELRSPAASSSQLLLGGGRPASVYTVPAPGSFSLAGPGAAATAPAAAPASLGIAASPLRVLTIAGLGSSPPPAQPAKAASKKPAGGAVAVQQPSSKRATGASSSYAQPAAASRAPQSAATAAVAPPLFGVRGHGVK